MKKAFCFALMLALCLIFCACGEDPQDTLQDTMPESCDHVYIVTDTVEASCKEIGMVYYRCEKCDHQYMEEGQKLPHVFDSDGYCMHCGYTNFCQHLSYVLNSDGTGYRVDKMGNCFDKEIWIPEKYCGIPVTTIGDAFKNRTITSITIPSSVTSIWGSAFSGCECLTSITIPDGVTSIKGYTFEGCTKLTTITIPDSVTSIEGHAFYECENLRSITIPDGVTFIGPATFYACRNLTSITIPDGVTGIGYEAFYCCSNLTCITIPDSVTSFGHHAFDGCRSLTRIIYRGTMEQWRSISKSEAWKRNCPDRIIISCTDGELTYT